MGHRKFLHLSVSRIVPLLLAGLGAAEIANGAAMVDLGTLDGGFSDASGISADGSTIVGYSETASGGYHVFKYSASVMTDLGTLGGQNSFPGGVSANGEVIVGYGQSATSSSAHAFKLVGTTWTDLGTLGGSTSIASGVSADGTVIVGEAFIANDAAYHAFIYSGNTMTDLGTLGGTNSVAAAVSGDGSVIAGNSSIAGNLATHAFKYVGGMMTDLGTLGGTNSYASAISLDGSTIVGFSDLAGNTAYHAFEYTSSGMTDLGTLGGMNSVAFGVSGDGSVIVGYSQIAGSMTKHAFVYAGGVMEDLGTLGGSDSVATGVSADGLTIVGASMIAGSTDQHAFVLDLHTPAWLGTPVTSNWNSGANWSTGTVPNASVTAQFGPTTLPNIDINQPTATGGMKFTSDAPAYTFSVVASATQDASLYVSGSGIVNGSSFAPQFSVGGAGSHIGTLTFDGSTSANSVLIANSGGNIAYAGKADGGTTQVTLNAGGALSIAGLTNGGISLGSIQGAGSVSLGANVLSVGGSNTDTEFSGNIAGAGTLIKVGTGTLTLSGANTENLIWVAAGTVQVGNGGTVGSVGVVDNTGGTLVFDRSDTVPVSYDIRGTGSLVQMGSGTLLLDRLYSFTGLTTVTHGTLVVGDAMHPGAGLRSSVTVASGGTLKGFGTIGATLTNNGTVAPGGSIGTLTVGNFNQVPSGTLHIEVSPSSASSLHATGEAALNGTLELAFDPGTYATHSYPMVTAAKLSGTFATVTASGVPVSEAYGVTYNPTAANLIVQPIKPVRLYSDLYRSNFDSAERFNSLVFAHAGSRGCVHRDSADGQADLPLCPELAFWYQIVGSIGSVDGDGSADAFNTRSFGAMGGFDIEAPIGFSLGLTASYQREVLTIAGGGARGSNDSAAFALSGGIPLFEGRVDIAGFYILNNNDAQRTVTPDNAAAMTARSHPKNDMSGAAVQYSQPVELEDITALVRLSYAGANQPAFDETGAAPYNIEIRGKSADLLYADIGLRFSHIFKLDSGTMVIPEASLGAREIIGPTATELTGMFAAAQGPAFLVSGAAKDRAALVGGVGFTALSKHGLALVIRADGRLSGNEREGVITMAGRLRF